MRTNEALDGDDGWDDEDGVGTNGIGQASGYTIIMAKRPFPKAHQVQMTRTHYAIGFRNHSLKQQNSQLPFLAEG